MTRFVEIALFTDVVDATRAFYERLLDQGRKELGLGPSSASEASLSKA